MATRIGPNPTSKSPVTLERTAAGSLVLLMIGRCIGLTLRTCSLGGHRTVGVVAGETPPGVMAQRRAVLLKVLAAAVVMIIGLLVFTAPAWAVTDFVVNSTAEGFDTNDKDNVCDSDASTAGQQCTLRAAIEQANATPNGSGGPDNIKFNISGTGVHKIAPRLMLPDISDPVVIDGYTQPGASKNELEEGNDAKLAIELDGTHAGDGAYGLVLATSNSTVRGLVIHSFAEDGIVISSGSSGNKVEGNFIGTDATGSQEGLGNAGVGVYVFNAPTNTIGGTTSGARNIISGNDQDGVEIRGSGASGNLVQGNYIGTDKTGTQDLSNSDLGVEIVGGPSNTIGGTTSEARNIISGNGQSGVGIVLDSASANKIEGNYIGTDATGTKDLGNSNSGVVVFSGAANNTVGGTTASEGNLIAFNDHDGVGVVGSSSTANAILSNSLFSNGELGIDLANDGVSANDQGGDGDTGPNDLQNFPQLSSATSSEGKTTIEGTLESTSGSTFTVQFFSSPDKDPSGHGEGKTLLGQQSVRTDSSGKADVSFATLEASAGEFVSATATIANSNPTSTSEFSDAAVVNTLPAAGSQSVTTGEDEAKTITLSATDAEGDELTFEITDEPNHGTLGEIGTVTCESATKSCKADLAYTPNEDYNGPDSFEFLANDGTADGPEATVSITVSAANDAPVAKTDTKSVAENTPLSFPSSDLTANDSEGPGDEAGQTLTVTKVSNPQHGTVDLAGDGEITFTPETDYNGKASFEYTVCDDGSPQKCSTQTATVDVTVSPVNSKPLANDGAETMNEDDAPITVDFGALVSDTETSDANLTYTIVSGPADKQGRLTGTGSTHTFDPADNYNGTVEILYTVTDRGDPDNCGEASEACAAAKTSDEKKVAITVEAVNDPPVAEDDSGKTNQNTSVNIDVLGNDSDPDGDTLSVSVLSGPAHGTATVNAADNTVRYEPATDYYGSDSFTYTLADGKGATDTATVNVTVVDNVAPTIRIDAPSDGGEYKLKQTVAANYSCQDNGSGVDTCTGTVTSGGSIDTSSVGRKTFTVEAKDKAGNTSSKTVAYTVTYAFGGFKEPVDKEPVYNTVKAGLVVPLRFSLGGNMGTNVLAEPPKFVAAASCPSSGAAYDAIEKTVPAKSASSAQPTYNSKLNEYVYNWATKTEWAGKCGQLVLKLKDGKEYKANFKFTGR